ncbi:Tripartite tricarboxylate transporter substrate binding protein [Bordetella sputigena]|uniref:Bug family tripartite tricarboxylate transporter substrate binding protein n=1 Tax=Bordetella sputigena TaxID=1416810 RepID=UPI0039EFC04C
MHFCKPGLAVVALLSSFIPLGAMAADADLEYPRRPITLVIGFPPGGGADALARLVARHMGKELGQNMIVDYRPGAAGNIGAKAVANAAADGYTIYLSGRPNTIHKAMYPELDYDFVRDLQPVGLVATMPYVVTVGKDTPMSSLDDVIALAKTYPGAPTCASAGVGTSDHLLCLMFQQETGTDIAHVPYRGSARAFADVIGGRVDMFFAPLPAALPHIVAGNLRAVAVMSRLRTSSLPHTPTIAEAGFPSLALDAWYGLVAPAATPPRVVARLNQSMNAALARQELREALLQMAYVPPSPDTPEAFGNLIAKETERWTAILETRKVQPSP